MGEMKNKVNLTNLDSFLVTEISAQAIECKVKLQREMRV